MNLQINTQIKLIFKRKKKLKGTITAFVFPYFRIKTAKLVKVLLRISHISLTFRREYF